MCVLREIWGDKMVAKAAKMAVFCTLPMQILPRNFFVPAERGALCGLFCVRR